MRRPERQRAPLVAPLVALLAVFGEFDDLDLRAGAPVKKLELAGGRTYSGNAVGQFVDAKLFTFQDLTDVAPAK